MEDRHFILGENEHISSTIYKHWIAVAPFIFVSIVMALLCLFGIYYVARNQPSIGSFSSTISMFLIIIIVLGLTAAFTFGVIWVWRANKIILTNEHIIDIEQLGVFRRNISTLSLANIQDISISISGPIQTILGYGTVIIQTAGERENFNLNYVPNPYSVERVVAKLHKDYHQTKPKANPLGKLEKENIN